MPEGKPRGATADWCYYCHKKVGKANLRRCSQCQFVKYCSRECQKAGWRTHRNVCAIAARNTPPSDDAEEYVHAFNKWLDRWRGHLYEQAIFAMDLANHPPDRLATHVVFILVERTEPKPVERERWFKVIGAEVLSREERATALLDFGMTQEQVDELNRDQRGDETIQINIIADQHSRMLWCSFRDMAKYRGIDKAASAAFAATWEQALIAKVASGKPGTQSDF